MKDGMAALQPDDETLVRLVALNNTNVRELSPLDLPRMRQLVMMSFLALRIDGSSGFILSMEQDAPYRNAHFEWFRARYDRYVYVDRLVVHQDHRGRGLARRLYSELFERASAAGHSYITCEVNMVPPNPASHAFHLATGFVPVGEAATPEGKHVKYYALKTNGAV